ncbi:MAG: hypothetical protein JWO82_2783 [Akkermansiaceae bacterium]|nr:hypothetical protein [Akkermansiaceae bacterium]
MLSSGFGEAAFVEEVDGVIFKKEFVAAIKGAQKVRMTEHSWGGEGLWSGPEVVYKAAELTAEVKAKLLAAVEGMATEPLAEPKRCNQPHHSIEFTDAAGKTSVMEVCFLCSQIRWPGMTAAKWPADVFPTLKEFLEKEGFQAERDWKALAVEAMAKKKAAAEAEESKR